MDAYKWRLSISILGLLAGITYLAPNFVNFGDSWWFTKKKINYGLDIQGGLHLVLGVDVAGVITEETQRMAVNLKTDLAEKKINITEVKSTKPTEGELQIVAATPADLTAAIAEVESRYGTVLQKMTEEGTTVTFRYFDAYMIEKKDRVLQQAIETIRNRIDEFGVAEPSISAQGADRINVQLPGVSDAEQAKALINTAAKLDFMMVDTSKTPAELEAMITEAEKAGSYDFKSLRYSQYIQKLNEDLKSKLPENSMVLFEKAGNATTLEAGRIPMLVKTDTGLGGSSIDDAFVSFNQYGAPEVSLRFSTAGAAKFSDLTGASIGKSMAIVLDRVIKSAPVIQSKISGGSAVITLGNSRDRQSGMDEAKMISMALRAGALPAALEQLEERTVGPTLGSDSIKKAELAGLVGAILIFLFMMFRYRMGGVVANITLLANILLALALLSSFGATLTLPGIAGIALTIGFAVDANVLIMERMREELAAGAGIKAAISEGYNRAMSAILDSNITTAATAVVLLYFGTGPVKGFAVTLLIGIVTTLFANVFLSKLIVDTLVNKFNVKKFSI